MGFRRQQETGWHPEHAPTCCPWDTPLRRPFSKCPRGLGQSKAVTPTLGALPAPPPSSLCRAAAGSAAGPGLHLRVWDLKSEQLSGTPVPLLACSPTGRSGFGGELGMCTALLCVTPGWRRRRGLRGLLCPVLSLRTPSPSFAAQILLRARHSPEKHRSENRIWRGREESWRTGESAKSHCVNTSSLWGTVQG